MSIFTTIWGSFSFFPHLTQTWILWSNEWFYKNNYEDQICLLWPMISLLVNFHDNRTKWTVVSNWKICRWGEKEKEPNRTMWTVIWIIKICTGKGKRAQFPIPLEKLQNKTIQKLGSFPLSHPHLKISK